MKVIARGTVQNSVIVTEEPLGLPNGTEVVVLVEPAGIGTDAEIERRLSEFDALGFHGMWADRDDMADSVAWVRKIRAQWQQRPSRQG